MKDKLALWDVHVVHAGTNTSELRIIAETVCSSICIQKTKLPWTQWWPPDEQLTELPAQHHWSHRPRIPRSQTSTTPNRSSACWGRPPGWTGPIPAGSPETNLEGRVLQVREQFWTNSALWRTLNSTAKSSYYDCHPFLCVILEK